MTNSVPIPRTQCPQCGGVLNPECPACVADQVQREIATVADLAELQEE